MFAVMMGNSACAADAAVLIGFHIFVDFLTFDGIISETNKK